ncbi:cell envelope-related transcriptional attenuator [Parafrankia sp. EAN1pec]|uniref:LCP family protein n=1 Tax=Parafrankia sp. (strain EAN1pec) TaxID=298653 RepID=UPI0000543844|nr:cell envelope-related transcriptional attenuator [Frankia sp. EAN1pec]
MTGAGPRASTGPRQWPESPRTGSDPAAGGRRRPRSRPHARSRQREVTHSNQDGSETELTEPRPNQRRGGWDRLQRRNPGEAGPDARTREQHLEQSQDHAQDGVHDDTTDHDHSTDHGHGHGHGHGSGWLPGSAGRRRGVASRLAVVVSAILSCLIFAFAVGGFAVYEHFDRQINRLRLSLDGDRPASPVEGTTNFLLVGSDSRAGTGGEFQRGGKVAGQRSDTTILAHLDANGTTTLVSFPRDTLVRIPGHGRDKLTQAISIGGPGLLVRTIENLTDIRVDHYVSVDLAGFREMTDAIGGVTVCVKALPDGRRTNLRDEWSQWRGRVGENHLTGDQALAFVRQRHGLPDNDFDRIRRQQQFIGAVFRKATSDGVLTSPARLENLISAVTRALTIDDGTDIEDLRLLAKRMGSMSSDQIRFVTIPVHAPSPAEGGNALGELPRFGSVQLYDQAQLDAFLAPLRGRDGTSPTAVPAPPASPPGEVSVDVFNAARVGGLAAAVRSDLASLGFRVGTPRDWPAGSLQTSEVRYGPGGEAAARAVRAVVPDARLVRDDDLADRISLVLGESFEKVDATGVPAAGARAVSGMRPSAPGSASTGSAGPALSGAPTRPTAPVTATELTTGCTY